MIDAPRPIIITAVGLVNCAAGMCVGFATWFFARLPIADHFAATLTDTGWRKLAMFRLEVGAFAVAAMAVSLLFVNWLATLDDWLSKRLMWSFAGSAVMIAFIGCAVGVMQFYRGRPAI